LPIEINFLNIFRGVLWGGFYLKIAPIHILIMSSQRSTGSFCFNLSLLVSSGAIILPIMGRLSIEHTQDNASIIMHKDGQKYLWAMITG